MHIIEIVDYLILLTEEALMIKPIRELWNSDRSKNKERFMLLASILYHMADPRSSYTYIVDEKDRFKAILEEEGLPKNYKMDDKLKAAIECYKKHVVTTSYLLVQRTKIAADKLGKFLLEVDLLAEDDKGKPKYTVNSIATAIKLVPLLVKDLLDAEKALAKEIEEEGRARGGNDSKKAFEDGI